MQKLASSIQKLIRSSTRTGLSRSAPPVDYFADHTIEQGARLHWLRQSAERDKDYRALARSSYPITET
jgi:hypothetical protein